MSICAAPSAENAGGPDGVDVRSSRLAKKAESARHARQRHKSHVTDLQTTLHSLRWQVAELQGAQRDREAAWFAQLTSEIEQALPQERRDAFVGWLAAAAPQAAATSPSWEQAEVALFDLAGSSASTESDGSSASAPLLAAHSLLKPPAGASPQSVLDDVASAASTGLSPAMRGIGLAPDRAKMPRREVAAAEDMECALGIIGLAERAQARRAAP